jgi:hypothetical protein
MGTWLKLGSMLCCYGCVSALTTVSMFDRRRIRSDSDWCFGICVRFTTDEEILWTRHAFATMYCLAFVAVTLLLVSLGHLGMVGF